MGSVAGRERGLLRVFRSIGGRFGWGVADQALSSLTNFALGLLAARSLPSTDFGAFAVVFAAYLIGLGAVRAITSEPFVIRFAAVSSPVWREGAASATGAAVAIGILGGVACAGAGLVIGGSLGTGLLALGMVLPGLLLQDTWRFTFFAARRGASAFANDLVWTVALLAGLTTLLLTGTASVGWFVVAWGGAGTVAGLFGIAQASVVPAPARTAEWVRTQRDLAPRFLGEFSLTTGVGQATTFGLGAIAGLVELGALRAGQILLGPLNVLFLGVSVVAVPEGVRALRGSREDLARFCRRLSFVLAAGALALGVGIWSVPDHIGTMVLRDNWAGGHSVVIPLAMGMALFGISMGAGVGLRSLAAARLSLRARLLVAPLLLVGPLTGATVAGAVGAAWGGTIAIALGVGIWWRFFLRGLRDHATQQGEQPPSPVAPEDLEPIPDETPFG
jgi:O-antigen/teichoic acid export membrane protein